MKTPEQTPQPPHPPAAGAIKPSRALVVCPYCGETTRIGARCGSCRGLLDSLSRQASQNAMGPWFIRDDANPFRPGCSYETLVTLVKRGKITSHTVIRGPTTRQFWCAAASTPGVSQLLGVCFTCQADVQTTDSMCDECGSDFTIETDRQHLGLGHVEAVPGQPLPTADSGVIGGVASGGRSLFDSGTAGGTSVGSTVPVNDLNDAIGVLARRLRTQSRLVTGLATSVIALLVTLGGLGVWVMVIRVSSSTTARVPAAVDPDPYGSASETSDSSALVPPAVKRVREQPSREAATRAASLAAHAPVAQENSPVEAPAVDAAPVDPKERRINDLVAKDTVASLGEALDLLPPPGSADAGKPTEAARRQAIERRREQLQLRGLP